MIEAIKLLLTFLLGAIVFSFVRKIIFRKAKETILPKIVTNSSIGKIYKKDGKEPFQWKKFFKIFDLGDGVEWIKSIKEIIDMRKLVIYGLIVSVVFAYGWFKGKQGQAVKIDLGYGKETLIKLDGHFLHINKEGEVYVEDKDGTRIKQIAVKDIPALKKKLAPIGFEFVPIGVIGGGVGENGTAIEGGAGVSWLRYWRWNLESFLTNKGIYPLGTSYKLTDNSNIGLGVGKGYAGDNRALLYYRWRF